LKKKTRPLFAWIGALVAAGGVFLFSETVMVLSVSNLDHPCSLVFRMAPSEHFSMYYTHSIYDAPVTEIFEAHSGKIVLKSVKTDSPAVMEYYGFEGMEPLQDLSLSLGPSFTVQIGMRQDQGLTVGERTIDLRTIGGGGNRIRVSLDEISLPLYLLSSLLRQAKIHTSIENG
jgi:hypothetical protein